MSHLSPCHGAVILNTASTPLWHYPLPWDELLSLTLQPLHCDTPCCLLVPGDGQSNGLQWPTQSELHCSQVWSDDRNVLLKRQNTVAIQKIPSKLIRWSQTQRLCIHWVTRLQLCIILYPVCSLRIIWVAVFATIMPRLNLQMFGALSSLECNKATLIRPRDNW